MKRKLDKKTIQMHWLSIAIYLILAAVITTLEFDMSTKVPWRLTLGWTGAVAITFGLLTLFHWSCQGTLEEKFEKNKPKFKSGFIGGGIVALLFLYPYIIQLFQLQ